MSLLQKTQSLLQKYGLSARKSLGQNFLIDDNVLTEIVNSADLNPKDTVVEIGAGLGILTEELTKRTKKVFAIELDDNLFKLLQKEFPKQDNLELIHQNALDFPPPRNYKLIANIPYYITGQILRKFLLKHNRPSHIVLLIQKEVAERICAKDGQHSLPSLLVQNFGTPQITLQIGPESFFPEPEVDSAVLRIKMRDKPIIEESQAWLDFTEQVFRSKRKNLKNALHFLEAEEKILEILKKSAIDFQRRAQTLSLEEWKKLMQNLSK